MKVINVVRYIIIGFLGIVLLFWSTGSFSKMGLSLTREKMLFGLFGDLKSKKIFITKKDGSTEIINVENDNIFFEKGNEWAIHKEVVQNVQKDGEIQSEHVNSYTIMGTEEKIVELAKDFTKTFQVEATFN